MKKWWKQAAVVGLLATGMFIGRLAYVYATEVPSGFQRVNFRSAAEDATYDEQGRLISAPRWQALDGKAIFVKGYMFNPGLQNEGLTSFFLLREIHFNGFNGPIRPSEAIRVNLPAGITTQSTDKLVSVSGRFQITDSSTTGSEFIMTAQSVEPAKTSF